MALIHEKLYQSESLVNIDLPDYLHKIISNLFLSYGAGERVVMSRINVENVTLNIDAVIPCALIINELVSNSLKHAFPDSFIREGKKGEILIDLRRDADDKFRLVVSDNGIGLPEGFEIQKIKSLGLQLVTVLAKQLNGTIEIRSDGGTTTLVILG